MAFDIPFTFSFGTSSQNALFLSSRWIDGALLSASSERGLLAVEHLQSYRPDQVWRATGCAAEWIAWDYGHANYALEALVIAAHNLSPGATLRYRLANTEGDVTAAPAVDTTAVSAWPTSGKPSDPDWPSYFSLLVEENPTGYRYGRLDIADPTNPDGYVQIGRLFAGPAFVPSQNVDLSWSLGLAAPGESVVTPFGRTFMEDRGPSSRIMQLPFSAMDQNELMSELLELERYCGVARDFAFCLDPAATSHFHRFAMQARFESLQSGQAMAFFNESGQQVWQKTLTLAEVL